MDNNLLSDREIPIGLGMALAQNVHSMKYFSSLNHEQQRQIVDQTHNIRSKEEMQQFVANLGNGDLADGRISSADRFI